MKVLVLAFIRTYQKYISFPLTQLFGGGCRFDPTCSDYSYQAVNKYGILKGIVLSIKRIISCHPFSSKSTYDPLK